MLTFEWTWQTCSESNIQALLWCVGIWVNVRSLRIQNSMEAWIRGQWFNGGNPHEHPEHSDEHPNSNIAMPQSFLTNYQ